MSAALGSAMTSAVASDQLRLTGVALSPGVTFRSLPTERYTRPYTVRASVVPFVTAAPARAQGAAVIASGAAATAGGSTFDPANNAADAATGSAAADRHASVFKATILNMPRPLLVRHASFRGARSCSPLAKPRHDVENRNYGVPPAPRGVVGERRCSEAEAIKAPTTPSLKSRTAPSSVSTAPPRNSVSEPLARPKTGNFVFGANSAKCRTASSVPPPTIAMRSAAQTAGCPSSPPPKLVAATPDSEASSPYSARRAKRSLRMAWAYDAKVAGNGGQNRENSANRQPTKSQAPATDSAETATVCASPSVKNQQTERHSQRSPSPPTGGAVAKNEFSGFETTSSTTCAFPTTTGTAASFSHCPTISSDKAAESAPSCKDTCNGAGVSALGGQWTTASRPTKFSPTSASSDTATGSTTGSTPPSRSSSGYTSADQCGTRTADIGMPSCRSGNATTFDQAETKSPVSATSVPSFFGKQNIADEHVAFDEKGRPIIVRQGYMGRTTVWKDDGSKRTFGKNTLQSLLDSAPGDSTRWLESLSDVELRGLVHEIGQQLLESSHLYRFHESKLECLAVRDGREYFGLTETSTLKDLENAYRKMAKRMHPDKNGGTDQAKRQFQQLSERYTAVKKRWGKNDVDAGWYKDKWESEESCNREDERESGKESGTILYDPLDRSSMKEATSEILRRMATIQKTTSAMQQPKVASSRVRVISSSSCGSNKL